MKRNTDVIFENNLSLTALRPFCYEQIRDLVHGWPCQTLIEAETFHMEFFSEASRLALNNKSFSMQPHCLDGCHDHQKERTLTTAEPPLTMATY